MLISPKLNLIFVHAPKTGGTSVRHLLRELDPGAVELRPHLRASDGQKLVYYWTRFFRFSICRHPCDTLVSHYCNIVRDPCHEYHGRVFGAAGGGIPAMSFSEWLRWHTEKCQASACAWFMDAPLSRVLRFESLADDFGQMIGLEINTSSPFPKLNVADNRRGRPWREYFSADDLQYVQQHYAEDFRRFNYSIDEAPARGTASVAAGGPQAP